MLDETRSDFSRRRSQLPALQSQHSSEFQFLSDLPARIEI
jgi:hypothetical protein